MPEEGIFRSDIRWAFGSNPWKKVLKIRSCFFKAD